MDKLPRVALEPLGPKHAPAMFEGLADPAGYNFLPDDPPINMEALRSRYNRLVAAGSSDGAETWLNWVIRDRENDVLVGYMQATIRGRFAIIGYHVFPACWRRGLATMALRVTLSELFATTSIEEVHAFVDTRNIPSIALLKKLGFNCLRTIAEADHFKGVSSDEYEFALSLARG